mmetsp:Transcript_35502/g.110753  ORF Transcript_35502/g.110753 Transcript_35502/m.110753 type:complete len:206 (-) Transcript_35502:372-989(-)
MLRYSHCLCNVVHEGRGEALHVVRDLCKGASDVHRECLAHRLRAPPCGARGTAPAVLRGRLRRPGGTPGSRERVRPRRGVAEGAKVCAGQAACEAATGSQRAVGGRGETAGVVPAKGRSNRLVVLREPSIASSTKGTKVLGRWSAVTERLREGGRAAAAGPARAPAALTAEGPKVNGEAAGGTADTCVRGSTTTARPGAAKSTTV